MSKWSHVIGRIKCRNLEGIRKLLSEQKYSEDPWKHYKNPYNSLKGTEGDVQFSVADHTPDLLLITGDLRDVDDIPTDKEQLLKDFKKIIELTDGQGYIEIKYEFEGTIVVDYYGEYDTRIFPQADGWDQYYEKIGGKN